MKTTAAYEFTALCMVASLLTGCMKNDVYNPDRIEEEQKRTEQEIAKEIASSFDYNLTMECPVTLDYERKALVEIYDKNPLDQRDGVATKLYAAFTDGNGKHRGTMVLPKSYVGKTLYARSNTIGVTYLTAGTVTSEGLNISRATSRVNTGFPKQNVSEGLIKAIESELPEATDNSSKLGRENDINLKINQECHIDVTFVHSGAGCEWWTGHWRDSYANCQHEGHYDDWVENNFDCNLYYFTYTEGNIPTAEEIERNFINDDHLIVGNANQNTTGGLQGTTVRLTSNEWGNTTFAAGTRIGWVITHPKYKYVNQWNPSDTETMPYIYSIPSLNAGGKSQSIRYQYGGGDDKVLLYGMEDLPIAQGVKIWGEDWNDHVNHDNGSGQVAGPCFWLNTDYDYNDILFTVKADPMEAIVEEETPVLPDAPAVSEYSEESDEGTLLYEDLFPSQGDYDMNDVVIIYKLTKVFDGNNELLSMKYQFTPVWDGANYVSGFSFMIDGCVTSPVSLFDNHKSSLNQTFAGEVVAGIAGKHKDDIKWTDFNPFIRVQNTRREVHLTKKAASPDADLDGLNAYQKAYVNNETNYPFAMKIPVRNFQVVTEMVRIDKEYPQYKTWVESDGTQATDWYLHKD